MFPRANTQSTILYRITMGAVVASAPTVGSNSEIYDYKGVRFGLVDLGGQSSLRSAWSQYFADTAAIILVIDSNDSARLGLAKAELQKLVKNEVSRGRRADAERSEACEASRGFQGVGRYGDHTGCCNSASCGPCTAVRKGRS